ncbi:integrase core domain-containing protein [Bordetella holmesii]|nr:integrase core domain-containing protein [Bordetella holmesii]
MAAAGAHHAGRAIFQVRILQCKVEREMHNASAVALRCRLRHASASKMACASAASPCAGIASWASELKGPGRQCKAICCSSHSVSAQRAAVPGRYLANDNGSRPDAPPVLSCRIAESLGQSQCQHKPARLFTSRSYAALVRGYGLRQEFITPHCPPQNGMVERVIRTLKEQRAHRHRFETIQHASRVIGGGIRFYHHRRRPHQALGMKPPVNACA